MSITISGFHTCHLASGKSQTQILSEVPYHSDVSKEQWLGQGYYFWTDSNHYAHQWGCLKIDDGKGSKKFKYPNGYIITKFDICIPVTQLLDLVGNVHQQVYFYKQVEQYLRSSENKGLDRSTALNTPISKVIEHLKLVVEKTGNFNVFPYVAIKAADKPRDSLNFLFVNDGYGEVVILPTRQQLCLFSNHRDCIVVSEWHIQVSSAERLANLRNRTNEL